jgi:REP element-mobilizing transposase RayT
MAKGRLIKNNRLSLTRTRPTTRTRWSLKPRSTTRTRTVPARRARRGHSGGHSGHSRFRREKKVAVLEGTLDKGEMPRAPRADLGGYCYHGLNRGNGRSAFHDPDDYHGSSRVLRNACASLPMRLNSFCLMPSHFHLVLWPQGDKQLGPWIQWDLTAHLRRHRNRPRPRLNWRLAAHCPAGLSPWFPRLGGAGGRPARPGIECPPGPPTRSAR